MESFHRTLAKIRGTALVPLLHYGELSSLRELYRYRHVPQQPVQKIKSEKKLKSASRIYEIFRFFSYRFFDILIFGRT